MGNTLKLSFVAVLFFIGCSSPKVEHIETNISSQTQTPSKQEAPQENQTPALKFQDIPTIPQEQVIQLQ